MSIAGMPVVRALISAATLGKSRTRSAAEPTAEDAAENDPPLPEASRARRVAWTLVLLLGWGFSYSIGWSKGWTVGAAEADARFEAINQCMINLPQSQAPAEAQADPWRMADGVETAATADQGSPADGAAGRL